MCWPGCQGEVDDDSLPMFARVLGMKQDFSLLYEGIEGMKAWLDGVSATYNFSHYQFEALAPEGDQALPMLKIFPDPRYPAKYFTITPDLERELWIRSNAESDEDHFPLGMYQVIFPWILDAIASSNEYYVTAALNAELDNPVPIEPSKRLSVQVSLWGMAVRMLADSATGELDEWFAPHSAENRAEASMRLPYHVAKLWEWINLGLENRLTEQGLANLEFFKSEFRNLGFEDNYVVNWGQIATNHGEAMADIFVDHVLKTLDEKQQQEEEKERNRKILGWVVPLAVGLVIAVGAALGY